MEEGKVTRLNPRDPIRIGCRWCNAPVIAPFDHKGERPLCEACHKKKEDLARKV